MAIQVWEYLAEYEAERADILAAVDQVLRSGRLILGESVQAFEREFAQYCGAGHGVGVNSGTDALMLALRALDIRSGDEVITTSNTAIPTVSAIVSAGGTPRFIDIDPDTYLMDVARLGQAVGPRTRCIIPVHLFGQCVDMDAVTAVAAPRGIAVLEDCAQSTGAEYRGRRAGSLSRVAAFSFYPTKILGAYGDGAWWSPRTRRLPSASGGFASTGPAGRTTRKSTARIRASTSCTPKYSAASSVASRRISSGGASWRAATTNDCARPA